MRDASYARRDRTYRVRHLIVGPIGIHIREQHPRPLLGVHSISSVRCRSNDADFVASPKRHGVAISARGGSHPNAGSTVIDAADLLHWAYPEAKLVSSSLRSQELGLRSFERSGRPTVRPLSRELARRPHVAAHLIRGRVNGQSSGWPGDGASTEGARARLFEHRDFPSPPFLRCAWRSRIMHRSTRR
jgi:hypothetical protein